MMDWKLWVSSLIFVLVTLMKLIFPEQTEGLRQQTVALIDMDMDYRIWATEVGGLLTDETVYEVIEMVDQAEVGEIHHVFENTEPEEFIEAKQNPMENSTYLDRVEAFRLSQEAYAGYDVPTNVSYDWLEIPFSYTAPVSGVCSSGFGYRMHPIDGEVAFHYGTDYDVKEGTSILSFGDGVVSAVGEEPGFGKYICIDHGNGWDTLYAHCSNVSVTTNQEVCKGDVIGESGQTGRVTGPHLHFELTRQGIYTNPEFFLP